MNKTIRDLQARRAASIGVMRAVNNAATAAGREPTADELLQFDAAKAAVASADAAIERETALLAYEASVGIVVPDNAHISVTPNASADPKRGFTTFGDYAAAVQKSGYNRGATDQRLAAVPGTVGSEGVGQDGGFLIPPEFSKDIFTLSLADDSLIPLTDNVEIGTNSMLFPKDETTPWGSDGVRAFWQNEGTGATATKPKFGTSLMQLHKLFALVPLTNELLDDTSALNSYLPKLVARSIMWKANESIINGDGAGRPQGALNANCAVTIAKETGQATQTVLTNNILKMIARLPPGSFPKSCWMITPDALPALFGLTLGNYPIYLPSANPSVGGLQLSPYGTLMGRPIMVSQHVPGFSAQGDISLVDMSYYRTLTKAGGMQSASSLHLYFDADATAFRTTFRLDGQPKILAPIAQAKGGLNLSPFVMLGAR